MPARSKKLLEPSQPGEDPELEGRQVPFADVCASSRRLGDQKGKFALFEAEVDEAVALVDSMAAEALAQEHVPVRLPALIHVFLHNCGNFHALLFEIVSFQGILSHGDDIFKHVIWHIGGPVDLGSLKWFAHLWFFFSHRYYKFF